MFLHEIYQKDLASAHVQVALDSRGLDYLAETKVALTLSRTLYIKKSFTLASLSSDYVVQYQVSMRRRF